MARRLSSPTFVGRSNELGTLLSTADLVASGVASIVLIGGEAGIGKSRLVAEAAGRLRDRGWLVLEGGSVPLGDDGLPFGPIVEALRDLARSVDADTVAAAAGPSLPELARLVPELSGRADPLPAPSTQAEWLQTRIFEGILGLLARLGRRSPVLLVIEDLHWADRSTRDLLSFLARNGRDERLLIVGTFRADELGLRHPLSLWLAEAERQPQVERIVLTRFTDDDVVELLTGIAGAPPTAALVDSIVRRSEGNAFFAEELAAAASEAPGDRERLPETLRGVLLVRLAATSPATGRVVEIAAVAGRAVDHDVLAAVCGLPEPDLGAALHEAVEAQLLIVVPDDAVDRYRFRHALAQEAAYDQLLPSERRTLHAAYARAIAARPSDGGASEASRLVDIAHHWATAHEPAHALAAAVAAGDASRAVYAYAEAARQYEHAIDAWDAVPPDDRPTDRDLVDLLDAASATAMLIGDGSRAVELARRAVDVVAASPAGSVERSARARERLGLASWLAGDTATSIRLLEEAVGLLEDAPPSIGQARMLTGLAANLMLAGRSAESRPFAERAIESARTVGDPGIESRAMSVLGVDLATLGNISGGIDLLRRSLTLASPVDDPAAIPRAHANLGSVLEMGGSVEEALEVSLAGVESARRYGSELSFGIFLEVNAAAMLIELGRYAEAAELLAGNVHRGLPGVSTVHLYLTLAHLAIRTGDLATARRHLEIARAEATGIEDAQFVIDLHTFGTEIALWEGDPAEALAIARDGFDRLADIDDAVILGQLALPAVHAGADLAVRARAGRDRAAAEAAVTATRDIIDRYRASTARLTEPDALAEHEIGWRLALCSAELARAGDGDRPDAWESIRPAVAARPAPFLEAYVLWRAAEAHAGLGESAAATIPLRAAFAIARTIGARLLSARVESLARRLRVDLAPALPRAAAAPAVHGGAGSAADHRAGGGVADHRAGGEAAATASAADSPATSAPADPFGLTDREREVLALVAEGYTNRRIAHELFISESTAGVHVSHILGKLGVDSRTEAAAVAVRLGLDRTPVGR
jgi:DNA-binding CsgD family transcriptional regulator/tetratricopeptide (TPR) repeat protein